MANLTGLTFGQKEWTPKFVEAIDKETCLGCGRCFKVCGHNVLTLLGVNEDGEIIDEDEDDDDVERQVMGIVNKDNCVGCEACAKICPKNCYTNEPLAM